MNFAELDGSADLLVQYDNAIDATTLDPNAFETAPNAHVSTGVTQTNDAQIGLSFGVDISEETELIYTGTTPHVVSPQTIAIT